MNLSSFTRLRCWNWLKIAVLSMSTVTTSVSNADEYAEQVVPILQTHCVGCHNPDNLEGGLDLSTYEGLLAGGTTGPALTPGATASSRLHWLASRKGEPAMPPDPEESLNESQLQVLADWIQSGAKGPDGSNPRPTLRVPKVEVQHSRPAAITAIAFSPDAKTAAFAQTGRVFLTKIEALKSGGSLDELATRLGMSITGFDGKVNALQFAADGQHLIVGTGIEGLSGSASIIELSSLQTAIADLDKSFSADIADLPHQSYSGHRDAVYAAVLSPDQKWLATAGYDRSIKIWNMADERFHAELAGHNGAVFELCFTPDSSSLFSASADQTVKVWDVESGARIDTLGQPEGEVYGVRFLPSFNEPGIPRILAISADNRLRVWHWDLAAQPVSNPLIETRFIDESPLLALAMDPSGERAAIASQSGNVKVISTRTWEVLDSLESLGGTPSGLAFSADGRTLWTTNLNGTIQSRPTEVKDRLAEAVAAVANDLTYLPESEPVLLNESELHSVGGEPRLVPLHAHVSGTISQAGEVDQYRWDAKLGEVWAIDVDPVGADPQVAAVHPTLPASGAASDLDPLITILDQEGRPVVQTRLQAIRESYFTFRGKDSMQSDDFRLFGQQDMRLDQFLFASGEVTRLWMHPRGPDSGFDVYPGGGQRWTYFGTSHVTHALGEPAYIVQPLTHEQKPLDNGLPTFELAYRNDDDPNRRAGKGSRLLFTAPATGAFTIAVQDARLFGGDKFHYQLRIRPARPDYQASVTTVSAGLLQGAGREFTVSVERFDGFDGPIEFTFDGLPPGVAVSSPIVVEAGQRSAQGTIWIDDDQTWPDSVQPTATATALVLGQMTNRPAGTLGELKKSENPQVLPWIIPRSTDETRPVSVVESETKSPLDRPKAFETVLQVRRGGIISAKVVVQRSETATGEVSFGNALAARNPSHGVYVDNIGLNGLLLLTGMNEREFFITAEAKTALGRRPFFLKAEIDGGITTLPIWLEVVE